MKVVTEKNKNTELALKLLKACMNCSVLDTKDYVGVLGFCLALNKQEGILSSSANLRLLLPKSKTLHFNDFFNKDIPVLLFAAIGSILKEEPEIDYQELYEEIISIALKDFRHDYRLLVDTEIPKEVFRFITELNGGFNGLDVYIPIAGGASFCLADNNSRTSGYEADTHVWLIGFFRLMFKGMESDLYINKDFLDYERNSSTKYDVVLVTFPWVQYPERIKKTSLLFENYQHNDSRTYIIEHALMNMKEEGVSYIFVHSSFLKWQHNTFYKLLLKQKYLQKVILFPEEIWLNEYNAIIILKKNETEKVCFIDATSLSQKTDDRTFELRFDDLLSAINKRDNKYIRYTYEEDIIVNRYSLYPRDYFMIPSIRPEIPSGYRYLKIREFLKPIENYFTMDWKDLETVCKTNGARGHIIKSKELTPHKFSYEYKCPFWDKADMSNGEIYTTLDKDLILMPNFGSFYENPMLYVHHHSLLDVYIVNSVKAFDYNPSLIDPLYFCHEFQKEYIQTRLTDNKVFNYPISDFDEILDIKMLVPSIEVQKAVYQQEERTFHLSKLQELDLDLVKEREKHNKYLSDVRHSMKNIFFHLNPALSSLSKSVEKLESYDGNEELLRKIVVDLNNVIQDVKRLKERTKSLGLNDFIKEAEPINLVEIMSHFKNQASDDYAIEIYIDDMNITNEAMVSFGRENLLTVIEEIIGNAVKHGFKDRNNKYTIRFELKLDLKSNNYILEISNNGEPMDRAIDIERFGTHGVKTIDSNGEGIGGYQIKTLIEHFKGSIGLIQDESSTFPVKFIIKLPKIQ